MESPLSLHPWNMSEWNSSWPRESRSVHQLLYDCSCALICVVDSMEWILLDTMQRVDLSSSSTGKLSFNRNNPCVFTCLASDNKHQPNSNSEDDNSSQSTASVFTKMSSVLSTYNTLSSLDSVIGGESINNMRVYDTDHQLTTTTDMIFYDYRRTIQSGEGIVISSCHQIKYHSEHVDDLWHDIILRSSSCYVMLWLILLFVASAKDMYWSCAHDLQPSPLEPLFKQIEGLLGMHSSPPLTAWVGSAHTGEKDTDNSSDGNNPVTVVTVTVVTVTATITLTWALTWALTWRDAFQLHVMYYRSMPTYAPLYYVVHNASINVSYFLYMLEQLHYDDEDNIHLMLHGRKRWLIFPPNAPLHYPTLPSLLFPPPTSAILQPDPCTSTLDASTQQPPIDITLSPGDLLYLPAAWSHQVQSLPDTQTSHVFSVNKFYPTSLFTCMKRGSVWAVTKCKIWDFKLSKEGWKWQV